MKKIIPEARPRRTVDCLSAMQVLYLALVYLADEQAQQSHKEDGDAKGCRQPCTASDSCTQRTSMAPPVPAGSAVILLLRQVGTFHRGSV